MPDEGASPAVAGSPRVWGLRTSCASLRYALCIGLLVLVAFAPRSSPAQEAPEVEASRLHEEARVAAGRGSYRRAASLWRAAMARQADWRYAFNLATVSEHLGDTVTAWQASAQAMALGAPPRVQSELTRIRRTTERRLLRTQALVELTVDPPDALVWLDGILRSPPYLWVTPASSSHLRLRAPGRGSQDELIPHPVGSLTALHRELPPLATRSAEGSDGAARRAPAARSLSPLELPEPLTMTEVSIAGWATLGSGLLAAAVGGGLLAWSETLAHDADGLSADDPSQTARYAELRDRFDAARVGGWTCVGVGTSGLVAGLVLLFAE